MKFEDLKELGSETAVKVMQSNWILAVLEFGFEA